MRLIWLSMVGLLTSTILAFEDRLPGSSPLEAAESTARSAAVLQGLHRHVEAQQAQMLATLPERWKARDLTAKRAQLRDSIGANLPMPATTLMWMESAASKSLWYEDTKVRARRVTWQVLANESGEAWAEGIWVEPKVPSDHASLVVPHTLGTVEALLEAHGHEDSALPWKRGDRHYLVLKTVNRDSTFSESAALQRQVALSHREWVHRQSFALGRTLTGYEVLAAEAGLAALRSSATLHHIEVLGMGEGSRVALFLAALDSSIKACRLHGDFGPRDQAWKEPLDRNIQGYVRDLGDAAVASMIAPRSLVISNESLGTLPRIKNNKSIPVAAPGDWRIFTDQEVKLEIQKARELANLESRWIEFEASKQASLVEFPLNVDPEQESRVKMWSRWSQLEVTKQERFRNVYWQKRVTGPSAETLHESLQMERNFLKDQVLGQLRLEEVKLQSKSRLLYETEKVSMYELWLEIAPDVVLWSWMGVPKSLVNSGTAESLPRLSVVVCQHGLEGLPEHTFTTDPSSRYSKVYQSYALKLAEQGYLTIAPHMPYRGEHEFRSLTRKLNGLGGTLYSVALLQHQYLLEWLKTQNYVDANNIGFYGLSYGGKIAMRIPAILTDYKFSICSGDFNDWIKKVSSDAFAGSYLFTKEYEIWEWNLAARFNHAEMAYLIAPRGFMVEYGHRDGVASSEWVGYEFGKIRRLYDRLGIPDQAQLRYFDGTHAIEGEATFEFIRQQFAK